MPKSMPRARLELARPFEPGDFESARSPRNGWLPVWSLSEIVRANPAQSGEAVTNLATSDAVAPICGLGGGRTLLALLIATFALSACRSSTPYGRCIGLNQDPDSTLRYEYSARNIVWGIVGVEFIAPPVIVGLNELRCPVARRPSAGGRQP